MPRQRGGRLHHIGKTQEGHGAELFIPLLVHLSGINQKPIIASHVIGIEPCDLGPQSLFVV